MSLRVKLGLYLVVLNAPYVTGGDVAGGIAVVLVIIGAAMFLAPEA